MLHAVPMTLRCRLGVERLVREFSHRIEGRDVAVLAHSASVDRSLVHTVDLVRRVPRTRLVRLLGPEHGFWGTAQDMIPVTDDNQGIEVVSLYGDSIDSLRPKPEAFDGVDVVVVDLMDVGSRYYTYAATMIYLMEEAAKHGVEVIVCDRPNPIGGQLVEGCGIDDGFHSFVGVRSMPQRHGLTIGELARWVQMFDPLDVQLTVIEVEGWSRDQWWDELDLPWVAPSPNIPTLDTATVYPGGCLVEGTSLSEGRGTTRPFEWMGAPGVSGKLLAAELERELAPFGETGCVFRPIAFRPSFHKFAGRDCGGVQIHVTNRDRFAPLRTALAWLVSMRRLNPDVFAWRTEEYEFVRNPIAIDLLIGSSTVREAIDREAQTADLMPLVQTPSDYFERRTEVALYPGISNAR